MVNQYFRWRCELLDNKPIQGEFSKDGWKWWKMWDGYYDLYGEMIQLPRWMCYDQQLTVVKQKCKEFVKVTIQWNWLAIWSRKKKVFILDFLFHLLFIFAHFWIFVSPFPDDQPQKEVMTVMNQWTNQLTKWWTNTSDGDVSYLTTDQFKVNSVNTIGNGERCEMDTTTWMVKWSNYQDGCVMTNSWLVKQKCKEFVKVAIQWIWRDMFQKKEGIYFKFSVSFICFSLHILVFLFHHFLTTNHKKKAKTVINHRISQLI